jgi:cellulose synthase/poly-beta-1,6-N-acetylglucosamine synthase-like glycosyltransferase
LLDVIVISDGSSDATEQIAQGYESTGRVRVLSPPRGGKALAINAGLRECQRELILLTDVRQILDVNCVRLMVQHFADQAVGVVSGSLCIHATNDDSAASVGMYRRYEDWIRSSLAAIDSTLGATGAIYAMRRSLAKPLPAGCILDDMWLPLQAVLAGKRAIIADECVVWDYPTDARSEFRRKVRTQAGLYQLIKLEPTLLIPWTNRLWGAFVSLKMGRLFMPHLLLICLSCSFFLPPILRAVALAGQSCLYGAALADQAFPAGGRIKRLTSVCHTFVVLMIAAFFAQSILFRNAEALWTSTTVRKH